MPMIKMSCREENGWGWGGEDQRKPKAKKPVRMRYSPHTSRVCSHLKLQHGGKNHIANELCLWRDSSFQKVINRVESDAQNLKLWFIFLLLIIRRLWTPMLSSEPLCTCFVEAVSLFLSLALSVFLFNPCSDATAAVYYKYTTHGIHGQHLAVKPSPIKLKRAKPQTVTIS